MQIKSAVFSMSARNIQAAPVWSRPEFAFIGRSNVGKSSMINKLSNKDGLAKVSATPGKTQLLNFFIMNDFWSLVDLPGYGYAKISKSEKINFNESVGDYLEQRENLQRVFVLIDSRLDPQIIDIDFVQW
ncbi:MAG: putative GTP-binding protein EngB, partial [Verrucomicrobiota bacterium]